MIEIRNLHKRFGTQTVLEGLDLDVKDGELLVILGESGSGKSVLLRHMIGLAVPDAGTVVIDGVDVTKLRESQLLEFRRKTGYLFQEGALYDFMSVYENIAFPLAENTGLKAKEIRGKVMDVLKTIGMQDAAGKMPSELSGGMKKRAALARAIVGEARILFCDEPTSGLDPIKSREISDLIKDCTRRLGCTTVVTSHDIENSFRIADRVVLLKDGKVIAGGTPDDLKNSTETFVQEFVA